MKNQIWQAHDPEFTRCTLLRLATLALLAGAACAAGQEFAGSPRKGLAGGPVEYAKLRTNDSR
jgi:hypothetical protein